MSDRSVVRFTRTDGGRRRCEVSCGIFHASATGPTDRDAARVLYARLRSMLRAVQEAGQLAAALEGK